MHCKQQHQHGVGFLTLSYLRMQKFFYLLNVNQTWKLMARKLTKSHSKSKFDVIGKLTFLLTLVNFMHISH